MNVDHSHHHERIIWWHLIAHAAAFCAAMAVAAVGLYPYYPKLQARTDSPGEAFGAFLTLCVIFGGLGPMVTLVFFAAQRLITRRRSAPARSRDRAVP